MVPSSPPSIYSPQSPAIPAGTPPSSLRTKSPGRFSDPNLEPGKPPNIPMSGKWMQPPPPPPKKEYNLTVNTRQQKVPAGVTFREGGNPGYQGKALEAQGDQLNSAHIVEQRKT